MEPKQHSQASATSRRRFINATAATIAAPYFVPSRVFGSTAPSNRINVACIGIGNQGQLILNRFLKQDDCQVVAVCDVNRGSGGYKDESQFLGREPGRDIVDEFYAKKSGKGKYKGCDAYADFRQVLER
ncbi:MAG: hypothetical protein AAF497_28785 [Planctomycetota bacterium]